MSYCYTKKIECPDISCSECKLAVHFYSMENNSYLGEGYYMPDFKTFENYALSHMKAQKIKDNKYLLEDCERYICLEMANVRHGVR